MTIDMGPFTNRLAELQTTVAKATKLALKAASKKSPSGGVIGSGEPDQGLTVRKGVVDRVDVTPRKEGKIVNITIDIPEDTKQRILDHLMAELRNK